MKYEDTFWFFIGGLIAHSMLSTHTEWSTLEFIIRWILVGLTLVAMIAARSAFDRYMKPRRSKEPTP